jgi:hypothetical protein
MKVQEPEQQRRGAAVPPVTRTPASLPRPQAPSTSMAAAFSKLKG